LEYIRPSFLVEKGNIVFLYDEGYGFFLFDNLGQYLYNIPMKGLESYQIVNDNTILFLQDGQLHTYDLTYKSDQLFKSIMDYTKEDIEDVLVTKKFIYLKDGKGIIKKPL